MINLSSFNQERSLNIKELALPQPEAPRLVPSELVTTNDWSTIIAKIEEIRHIHEPIVFYQQAAAAHIIGQTIGRNLIQELPLPKITSVIPIFHNVCSGGDHESPVLDAMQFAAQITQLYGKRIAFMNGDTYHRLMKQAHDYLASASQLDAGLSHFAHLMADFCIAFPNEMNPNNPILTSEILANLLARVGKSAPVLRLDFLKHLKVLRPNLVRLPVSVRKETLAQLQELKAERSWKAFTSTAARALVADANDVHISDGRLILTYEKPIAEHMSTEQLPARRQF